MHELLAAPEELRQQHLDIFNHFYGVVVQVADKNLDIIVNDGFFQFFEFSDHFAQIHTNWHSGRHKGKFTLDQIFGVTPDVVRHVGHMYIECGERSLEFHSAYLFDASKLSDTGS